MRNHLDSAKRPTITHEDLLGLVHYDPETGLFTFLTDSRHRQAGSTAEKVESKTGYIYISLRGRKYLAHRLAYFYVTGAWPEADIDHRDHDRANNRWSNIRPATRSQNLINRRGFARSGAKNISAYETRRGTRYRCVIRRGSIEWRSQSYTTIERAIADRDAWLRETADADFVNVTHIAKLI